MTHRVTLDQWTRDICLIITTSDDPRAHNRAKRIWMTPDQAQHLSNRLQAYAKGGYNGKEMVFEEGEGSDEE